MSYALLMFKSEMSSDHSHQPPAELQLERDPADLLAPYEMSATPEIDS